MTATVPPEVPARPSKSSCTEDQKSAQAPEAPPAIPARPVKKVAEQPRPSSSNRFAPSPLHGGFQPKNQRPTSSSSNLDITSPSNEPIERPGSTTLPSLGEEGLEYCALENSSAQPGLAPTEQTRTVSEHLKLHAPKPSLPADSAKQQIMAVTRTDSARAASLGLGRPSQSGDRPPSRDFHHRRPSSTFSLHSDHGNHTDEEHGIPLIGQRVPMSSHLGDVQAPSPNPEDGKKYHNRKHSARHLPPGSYGLHGHGVDPQDKLEKAYFEKHPELVQKEQKHHHVHDHRQSDYAMSSNDLNRMVRDTSKRRPMLGSEHEAISIPTEDVAYHASDEYAIRISSPQRPSQKEQNAPFTSEIPSTQRADYTENPIILHTIHVDDSEHPEHRSFGDDNPDNSAEYQAPILAGDEIDAGPDVKAQNPAIRPGYDRSRSYDVDEPRRPSFHPHTLAEDDQPERAFGSTPLEDVEEYEPLFGEENQEGQGKQAAAEKKPSHHFPSKDIWEDAPSSVHYSTEVSTPDVDEQNQRPKSKTCLSDGRSFTPAQAFAQYQEKLAEKEAEGRASGLHAPSPEIRQAGKPSWIDHQPHLAISKAPTSKRFPSKDIWEDAPDSHVHEATLSASSPKDDAPDSIDGMPIILARPAKPAKKAEEEPKSVPALPSRPKPKQGTSDEDTAKQPPPISDKPKPQIPNRPAKKLSGDSKDGEAVKPPKPPVPSRPFGGKIAALQAGFMSDLNKRLQLGPQAMKKEEPAQEETVEEKEKVQVPLSDARKGRARGPQRRAPAKAAAPPVKESNTSVLSISLPQTLWSLDPENCVLVAEQSHGSAEHVDKSAGPELGGESSVSHTEEEEEARQKSSTVVFDIVAGPNIDDHTKPAELALSTSDTEARSDSPVVKPCVKEVDEEETGSKNATLLPLEEDKPALEADAGGDGIRASTKDEEDIGDESVAKAAT